MNNYMQKSVDYIFEKMNKQIFEDNHKANQRIMQLEEENAYLRQLSCGCD